VSDIDLQSLTLTPMGYAKIVAVLLAALTAEGCMTFKFNGAGKTSVCRSVPPISKCRQRAQTGQEIKIGLPVSEGRAYEVHSAPLAVER
jgi:hypothetical protein